MVPRLCLATPDLEDINNTRACRARCRDQCLVRCLVRWEARCRVLTWTDTGCRHQVWRAAGCQDQVESHLAILATRLVWEDPRDQVDLLEVKV